jgi:ribosomal protein L37AE/L43A
MADKQKAKKNEAAGEGPRCPTCGRRKAVRKLDARAWYCDHCQQMFHPA